MSNGMGKTALGSTTLDCARRLWLGDSLKGALKR